MKKLLPLLFATSLLISACSITNIKKDKIPTEEFGTQDTNIVSTESIVEGNDAFRIKQTDDNTVIYFNGKIVKTWSHEPPAEMPFVWDDACKMVLEKLVKLPNDQVGQYEAKQEIWNSFSFLERKQCMKENFLKSVKVKKIDNRFYEINKYGYEGSELGIYDTKTGNIQDIPASGGISITASVQGIIITIENDRGDYPYTILNYDTNFTSLLSQENK